MFDVILHSIHYFSARKDFDGDLRVFKTGISEDPFYNSFLLPLANVSVTKKKYYCISQ